MFLKACRKKVQLGTVEFEGLEHKKDTIFTFFLEKKTSQFDEFQVVLIFFYVRCGLVACKVTVIDGSTTTMCPTHGRARSS